MFFSGRFQAALRTQSHSFLLITSILLLSLSGYSYALEPYQATYSVSLKSSISMKGTLSRSLTKNTSGQWLFEDEVSALLASIKESSLLSIENDKIQPLHYRYLRKVIGKKKKQEIQFNWKAKQAVNLDKKIIPLQPNTQDALSYQLQLQLDLQNGQRGSFHYPITKKNRVEVLKFIEVGEEVVDTPLGKLNSIKLKLDRGNNAKRETYIWFSIADKFVISKLKQTESDGKSYSILLSKLTR